MFTLLRRFVICSLVAAAAAVTMPARAQTTMVRLQTTMGAIDMALVADAPITTANFLAYVRGGDYVDVFFHRNAWLDTTTPFVIQSGGYRWPAAGGIQSVASHGAITNEFDATRSNLRGTVAMAKLGSDPNSATSQWFVNMGSNAGNLDTQNGGFTVFARVTTPGMATADRIAALPNVNVGSPFNELPVAGWQGGTTVQRSNVVRITSVAELPSQSQTDRIFNYLEATYPQYLGTAAGSAGDALGYVFRYYAGVNGYIGVKDATVWYLVPAIDGTIHALGPAADWLAAAQAAGY